MLKFSLDSLHDPGGDINVGWNDQNFAINDGKTGTTGIPLKRSRGC